MTKMRCNWKLGFSSLRVSGPPLSDNLYSNRHCGIGGVPHQLALNRTSLAPAESCRKQGQSLDPSKPTAEEVG